MLSGSKEMVVNFSITYCTGSEGAQHRLVL